MEFGSRAGRGTVQVEVAGNMQYAICSVIFLIKATVSKSRAFVTMMTPLVITTKLKWQTATSAVLQRAKQEAGGR